MLLVSSSNYQYSLVSISSFYDCINSIEGPRWFSCSLGGDGGGSEAVVVVAGAGAAAMMVV